MKTLIYDIETLPLHARVWRCGDQTVRHNQLMYGRDHTQIICIQYCINDGPIKIIKRDLDNISNQLSMVEEFDEIVRGCDIVIGKNSDRFDNKHINTIRMLSGGKPMPDWIRYTDDLEKQMRKYFSLPSNTLDYISYKLGFGGKNPMEFSDWVNIDNYFKLLRIEQDNSLFDIDRKFLDGLCNTLFGFNKSTVEKRGKGSLKKMYKYGCKDTDDTRRVWNYCKNHFEPRYTSGIFKGMDVCQRCGSRDIIPDRPRSDGRMSFYCKKHNGYAGRARILKSGGYGRIT